MIVSMNNYNSDSYIALFTEAYNYLKELDNGYVEMDKERFGSLAEYYSHMADFFENQKYKFVMLPIEEEPFKIDLNTRTIEVPQSFSKCASVQSDQLAETIIFIVDRYFDYMDLANTEIYVQWTIPENKKTGVKEYNGATRVEMIDLETEPGKIKFAWPLNNQITEVPGPVKFSVRFFRLDDSAPNKLLYSLNTTDKEIIIKEALQPTLTSEHNVESPISDDSFKKAIINSLYATEGVVPPVQPAYTTPGSNIYADTMVEVDDVKIVSLNNDTITLKVQAIVADAGDITYKWYHKNDNGDEYFDCEKYPVFDADGKIVEGSFTTFGTVKDVYLPFEVQPTVREAHERYYVPSGNSYILYTEAIPAPENVVLYERYSTFKVPDSGEITGYYQAAAWNNIPVTNGYSLYRDVLTEEEFDNGEFYVKNGKAYDLAITFDPDAVYYVQKVLTTLYPARSNECLLPPPAEIAFKVDGNLMPGKILTTQVDEEGETTYSATLTVDTIVDNYNPSITYEWRQSAVSELDAIDTDKEVFITTDVNSLDVHEPGWYSVNVVSELNRTVTKKISDVCKVTKKPEPPVVEAQSIGGSIVGYVNKGDVTFRIDASINNPDNLAPALLSDNISYVWQVAYPDTDEVYINIPEGFAGVSGLGTPAITVTNKLKTNVANFRCLVINELNDAKAIFDHTGAYVSDGSLGEFKAEAPYIYEDSIYNYVFTAINF